MNPIYLHIGSLIAVFITALAFYFEVMMNRMQITYTRRYGITCIYFLLLSVITISIEYEYLVPLFRDLNLIAFNIFLGSIGFALLLYWSAREYLPRPATFIEAAPRQTFLRLDYRYLLSKGCEIVFQQIIVIILALLLADAGFSLLIIMISFAVVFAAAHTPLIFYDQPAWGWYYTIFSFISGFIFPPLILLASYGFIFSLLVHWLFYVISGVLFWLYQSKHIKKP